MEIKIYKNEPKWWTRGRISRAVHFNVFLLTQSDRATLSGFVGRLGTFSGYGFGFSTCEWGRNVKGSKAVGWADGGEKIAGWFINVMMIFWFWFCQLDKRWISLHNFDCLSFYWQRRSGSDCWLHATCVGDGFYVALKLPLTQPTREAFDSKLSICDNWFGYWRWWWRWRQLESAELTWG